VRTARNQAFYNTLQSPGSGELKGRFAERAQHVESGPVRRQLIEQLCERLLRPLCRAHGDTDDGFFQSRSRAIRVTTCAEQGGD
jgi:hypothetical protein